MKVIPLTSKWSRLQRYYLRVGGFMLLTAFFVPPKKTFYTSWSEFFLEIAARLAFVLALLGLAKLGADGGVSALRITPAPPAPAIEPESKEIPAGTSAWFHPKPVLILAGLWLASDLRSDWHKLIPPAFSVDTVIAWVSCIIGALVWGTFFSLFLPDPPMRWPRPIPFVILTSILLGTGIYVSRQELFTPQTLMKTALAWSICVLGAVAWGAFGAWITSTLRIRWPKPIPFAVCSLVLFSFFALINKRELFTPHAFRLHWFEWLGCVLGSLIYGAFFASIFAETPKASDPLVLSNV